MWLFVTKGYGFTVDDINWSCPADLEPYAKAHEQYQKEQDTFFWLQGQYNALALDATVCNAELWRKKGEKAHEYPKEPLSQQKKPDNLTEEEKLKYTELIFAGLNIMQNNFEIAKERENGRLR